jgi:uncharacterized protein
MMGLSLILSVVYVKTRSLFLCVLLHAIDNAYKSIFMLPRLDSSQEFIVVAARFIVCVTIFIMFVYKGGMHYENQKVLYSHVFYKQK